VLAAADYTSGVMSRRLPVNRWTIASLDLTVNLTRSPEGEWVACAPKPTSSVAAPGERIMTTQGPSPS
jgi:hypothetical protein